MCCVPCAMYSSTKSRFHFVDSSKEEMEKMTDHDKIDKAGKAPEETS